MLDFLLTDNILEQTSLKPKLLISNLENYFRIYRRTICILYVTGFLKRNFLRNDKLPRTHPALFATSNRMHRKMVLLGQVTSKYFRELIDKVTANEICHL